MIKSSLSYRSGRCGNEASRRLYRGAAETALKLDHRLNNVSNFVELFSTEVTDLRTRLKDYCERLIFTDPVEYGKKAEDLLWRKVFYEFFQKCKQNRKKLFESEFNQHALRSHLLAGIGSYHHMLLRIQTEFHLNLNGKVNVPFMWQLKGVKKERWKRYEQSAEAEESIQSWAIQACHHILIYLGDLARYLAELHEPENCYLAERYYQQAFCLNYKSGTPHNQLGSLASNNFDSAYHYMRCLASHNKFDGAEGNLIRVFEKNTILIEELNSLGEIAEEPLKSDRFLSRFLSLCELFFFSNEENSQIYCQETLQDFDTCLSSGENSFTESDALKDDNVFKVVVMAMMCMSRLHEKGSPEVSTSTAFTLALFSHIVHNTTKRLVNSVYETTSEKTRNANNTTDNQVLYSQSGVNAHTELLNKKNGYYDGKETTVRRTIKKTPRKKFTASHLRTLRRRRKRSSTSQEDSELSDGEMMEVVESDDENGLLNSDVSQTGSCSSESLSEHEEEDLLLVEQNNRDNESKIDEECFEDHVYIDTDDMIHKSIINKSDLPKKYSIFSNETKNALNGIDKDVLLFSDKLIHTLQKIGLLQCLKILVDWLGTHKEILSACAESSRFLLSRLIELLNLLLRIESQLLNSNNDFSHLQRTGDEWKQELPLPEDTLLQHFPALENTHAHLSFDISKRRKLSPSDQVFLRLQCLLSFGNCLTQTSESSIAFDKENNKYFFKPYSKSTQDANSVTCSNQDVVSRDMESQRQKLMQGMAHLWLKSEVNNLEMLVESSSVPQLSPYLVTDASVLCSQLSLLEKLISTKRFIVIVPKVVIDNLDQLKKKSLGAREAIRWLESIFQKGSRHIRAQRDLEKASLVPMKYPKKKDKDAWDLFQILECCHFLVQQQSAGKCSMVTLVVGTHHQLPSNAIALSHSINVSMESLEQFFSKWRNSSKNPG